MTYAIEVAAVRRRLEANWTETRIAWPNADFEPALNEEWIRLAVLPADAYQAALGGARQRYIGLAIVQVFTPANSGDGRALELADGVVDLFQGVTDDGVRYEGEAGEVPRAQVVGVDGRGFYQVNVLVPYSRDSTD